MEGISQEAIALAGHLKLNKLIVFWDNNSSPSTAPYRSSDSTDQIARFKAYDWNTIEIDGHDQAAIAGAIEAAHKSDRPTFIACKTDHRLRRPEQAGHPQGARQPARRRRDRRPPARR